MSPVLVDSENQRIYWSFGVTQQNQFKVSIISLDLATCSVIWSRQIQDSNVTPESPFGLIFNKDAVFLTENNALWVFGASSGNLAKHQQFDHYVLPPVKSGDMVFVAADLLLTAYV